MASFAVRARWVLPIDGPPIHGGIVSVRDGRIEAVGRNTSGRAPPDFEHAALLPGLVNAHTHLEFSDLTKPLGAPGMRLPDWIRQVIAHRQEQPGRPVDAVVRGLEECANTGTTTVGEIATPGWSAAPFDAGAHERFVDDLIEAFSETELPGLARAGDTSPRPVFIAGMPRSGTTLVEQIIDAHPAALGAGEIEDLPQMSRGMQVELNAYDTYPHCVSELSQTTTDTLAARYSARLDQLGGGATRVVNKSLENYLHLGLVALICPGARVIHCRRHPLDTCLSCYMGGILPARAPYVTDLGNLGRAYRQYERLMRHWQRVLDTPILEIVYEDLVKDLEGTSRRMIDFLGLEWDERCLRYYESGRAVLTLSYAQVNKPIYTSAVGRYRHYEKHLGPLKDALAGR